MSSTNEMALTKYVFYKILSIFIILIGLGICSTYQMSNNLRVFLLIVTILVGVYLWKYKSKE